MSSQKPDRRQFLGAAGAGLLALADGSVAWAAEPARRADQLVAGKDAALVVREQLPFQFETPLELLDKAHVTPTNVLFVRNNQNLPDAATLKPLPLKGWQIELTGLLKQPGTVKGADLSALEQVEYEMILQCSGNGRALYAKTAPVKGQQWGQGAVGNVRFSGVPLRAVLAHAKIEIDPAARFVAAEGKDEPAAANQPDFEHSLPLDDVLEKSILALKLNGADLPAVHGGPVRLVTPGYYGTMQLKWLTRLRFEATESASPHHSHRYRVPLTPIKPGSAFVASLANSRPNWRLKINTIILGPLDQAQVRVGRVSVHGVAFNDGAAPIEMVELSADHGQTWQSAKLEAPKSPYAWYHWSGDVVLKAGPNALWARAIDALGRTQPLDGGVFWNPDGYEWNGVARVAVTAA